ncbi:MAG: hypothetical protein Q9226_005712 [Calogaya cf. arnoldii]
MHPYMFRYRNIGLATVVVLTLLCSFNYYMARLLPLHISDHRSDSIQPARDPPPPPPLKAAVIIECRNSANLIPLILHFSSVLGPEWPIKVLHCARNRAHFSDSPAFQRQVSSGHITLQQVPSNITFTDPHHGQLSEFLTNAELYHSLGPYKHLLFFQTDSILCANSPRLVEDFLEYDFVGAPIDAQYGHGMNGGLSLRNREKMLEVLERNTYIPGVSGNMQWEDQWFIDKLEKLPLGPNNETGANLPTPEVAGRFSVETIWQDRPFGLHQAGRFPATKDRGKELAHWCPEFRLATPKAMLV